ncbi:Ribonucleases G and E [Candidatus Bartonella washoeensis]|uniref:phage major tropism determinant n=1 Tax=Candidatus Bartonella washoeensis TaxID=186739 RepID=UPI000D953A67|nr:hypothetical protein [Bartonella washoeensis]SPU27856.1 Ribonucleases G and E [Bartonella washoeensis]
MGIPYHTHEYQIPAATKEDIIEGTSVDKVAVPKSLGSAAVYQYEAFATAEQGAQAKQAAEVATGIAKIAKQTADEAKAVSEQAKTVADEAKGTSNTATAISTEASKTATQAATVAAAATETANGAKATADNAQRVSEEAKTTAEASQMLSQQSKSACDDAKQIASEAKTIAEKAKSTAEEAKQATLTAQQSSGTSGLSDFLKDLNLSVISVSTPFLVASGKKQLQLKKGTHITLSLANGVYIASYSSDTVISISSLSAGKDYYVYLVPDGNTHKLVLSENATFPHGYTATNSRKIGGFHTLCADVGTISGHPLSGYRAGDILPQSVWCLNHRPHSSPEGMVYDPSQDIWVDIYLQSGTGENTRSEYGVPITTNRGYTDHVSDMMRVKKTLLSDTEFASAMYGSNDKTSIEGKEAPSPKHSGGHVDTEKRRMISYIGCEDGCGYVWQFLRDVCFMQTVVGRAPNVQFKKEMHTLLGGGEWSDGTNISPHLRTVIIRNARYEASGARGCSRPRNFV